MRCAALVWLLVASIATSSTRAAIEIARFKADGLSTYCKVAASDSAPFYVLSPASKGKCPVAITMTATMRSVTALTATFDIEWNITVNQKRSDELFPVELEEGFMNIDDTLTACEVETNCESQKDLILPRGTSDELYDSYVEISSKEAVVISSYRLRLPPTGDTYLIVGDITVNIESEKPIHNYAFLKVRVSPDVLELPGTVHPAAMDNTTKANATTDTPPSSEVWVPLTPTPTPTVSAATTPDPSTDAIAQNANNSNGIAPSHGTATNAIVLAGIAVAALMAATIYFVTARRSSRDSQSSLEPGAGRSRGASNCRNGFR